MAGYRRIVLLYFLMVLLIVVVTAMLGELIFFLQGRNQIPDHSTHTLTDMAYVDSRIQMAGLILFGPKLDRSILRSVRPPVVDVDNSQCLKSTLKLFKKHCGLSREQRLKHMRAFANMCNYVADKRAIEEAFILVCGMNNIEPYRIDVRNPTIDVTPIPVRGSSYLCGRAYVNGISRMEIQNYAKSHRLLFVPSFIIPGDWRNKMVQICLHKNASLGLCQCKKDDWKSVEEELWSPVMAPFGQKILDVKFLGVDSGFLTVTLVEESKVLLYELLAIGNVLLFIAPVVSKYILSREVDDKVAPVIKWATYVLAITSIFLSPIDGNLAFTFLVSYHAIDFLISYIRDPQSVDKFVQWLHSKLNVGEGDGDRGLTQSHFPSTFNKTPYRKKFSKKELEEFAKKSTSRSVGELASSSEFVDRESKHQTSYPSAGGPKHLFCKWE